MAWHHRILNIFRSNRISRDIEREIEFHIAERVDHLRAGGMSEEEARRLAKQQFGNETAQRERVRGMDIAEWVESVTGDIRYALRSLRHSPVFAIVAIASLGLGIGANTTIFTLLDAVMLRPLAVAQPDELAYITMSTTGKSGPGDYFTNPLWEQIRDRQDAFRSITAFGETDFNLTDGGEARRVVGWYVSGDFFSTFAVAPAAGRLFSRGDDVRGCGGSAVLSHRFWQREYSGRREAIGSVIRLTGHPFEIAGVTEESFRGPDVGREADVYLPICAQAVVRGPDNNLDQRSSWWMRIMGRLKPGIDLQQAHTRIAAIARASYESAVPQHWRPEEQREFVARTFHVRPAVKGFSDVRDRYGSALLALMAGVALILLIACANVANLLLSRAESRHRELAIRLAIGADRGRLLRQLLTESIVLAAAGAIVGLAVASVGTRALVALITTPDASGAVSLDLALNGRLLAFTILVATVTVMLCGLVPAWRATRVSAQAAMKAQSRGVVEGHTRFRFGKALVVVQVALSLVLVVSAGFLVGSFRNLTHLDPGFDARGVLLATVDLRRTNVAADGLASLHQQFLDRARTLPGVTHASSSDLIPMGRGSWNDEIIIDGFTPKNREDAVTWFNEVSPGYFSTMRTRILGGRDFGPGDVAGAERVAIVNEAWGRRFFGEGSPLGRQFRLRDRQTLTPPYTIVGVVENAVYQSLRTTDEPTAYVAQSQATAPGRGRILELRTNGDPLSLIPALRSALTDVHPAVTLEFKPLERQLADSLQRERMLAVLSGLFGSVALALAILGLYGVTSYSVARRRNELGVRIALGAVRARVIQMVLSEVGIVVMLGLLIGSIGAQFASKLVAPFLYGTEPADPAVHASAVVLLAVVAFIAGLIPAWRASRVDPIEALREQ
jgi:putative ABC transport system permease protein